MTDSREHSTSDDDNSGVDKMHHQLSDMLRTSLFYDLMKAETEWRARDEEDRRKRRLNRERKG